MIALKKWEKDLSEAWNLGKESYYITWYIWSSLSINNTKEAENHEVWHVKS